MKRISIGIIAGILLSGLSFGQSAEAPAAFDLADVHVSPRSMNPNFTGGFLRGSRYEARKATMLDLIAIAYGVESDKVLGGPSWLETDRFDVIAKAAPTTSPEALKVMLQVLLADRFKLVIHKDTKPLPGFALTVGKSKPKMKEAEGSAPSGCEGKPQPAEPGVVPLNVVACHNMTMEEFAKNLRGMAGGYLTSQVVDMTGLKGSWDLELKWHGRGQLARAGADAITIFDAVDKQLGLKLDSQKIPTPVIVVDSVNQTPTANPPGITTSLPAAPLAEFEVADIKPSLPDAQINGRIQNGRVDLQGFPMKQLIMLAWDINSEDLVAGMAKWMDSAHFDVVAKVSVTPSDAQQFDIDTLRLMLRALLVERFNIKTHMENREISAYNLVAAKPKLTKADPLNRANCKEGSSLGGKDPRDTNPVLSRLVTCQNTTMAQFADRLQSLAPGYIHSPVLDATGLDGAYDFTISFSPAGALTGAAGGGRGGDAPPAAAGPGGAPGASDPSGAISLPDALSKQLGLKLEQVKRPVPVLVLDHVEEKPTDN